ncbi:helix-turn-helix domain-containing protein [Streptomyces cinerochromogenes]|uniref:helix-turn-helix domain-containing protein n=1 Tax=Streptomyces cinerochromogenes TaxID=66422 RepID=UPI0033A95C12
MGPSDLPEVRALTERLVALRKEAELSQGELARRFSCSKSQVSRYMSGEAHPPQDTFVLPLARAVGEHRKRHLSEQELRELRLLHEHATLARAGRNRELHLVGQQLAELRAKHAVSRLWLAGFSAAAFALALGYGLTAMNELAKGATSVHGDAPEVITKCVQLPSGAAELSATCVRTQWRWSMPASTGKGIEATFALRTGHDTGELGGVLRLDTACGTAVRWSVTVRVAGAGTTELAAGRLTASAPVTLYAPLHRDARTLTFTARRTEGGSCAAHLVWDRPRPAINY